MKKLFVRKDKSKANTAIPLIIDTTGRENIIETLVLIAIRVSLLCLASVSVCVMVLQIYKIPLDQSSVAVLCLIWSLIFNIIFILLKYRFAFPLIVIVGFTYFDRDLFFHGFSCIKDFFLLRLDSRLLYTSRFASVPVSYLENPPDAFIEGLNYSFSIFSVIICLIFAISSRGKFVGSILITTMAVLIPAFGAEIATITPAMLPLVISMFGLFSIWAGANYAVEETSIKRKRISRNKPYLFGGLSELYKYSLNGLFAVLITGMAFMFAERSFTQEKTVDFMKSFGNITESLSDFFVNFSENFRFYFSSPDERGYFPSGKITNFSLDTSYLMVTNPSSGRTPLFKVLLDDVSTPIYLRNGIGIDYNSEKNYWETRNKDEKVQELNTLLENYNPEHNYYIYRQKVNAIQNLAGAGDNYIGIQQVSIEYLIRTKSMMIPTAPYLSDYKNNKNFSWNIDTVLKLNKNTIRGDVQTWDVLFPKFRTPLNGVNGTFFTTWKRMFSYNFDGNNKQWDKNSLSFLNDIDDHIRILSVNQEGELNFRYPSYIYADVLNFGMTAAEYLEKTIDYENLIKLIYTVPDDTEEENIKKFLEDIELDLYSPLEQHSQVLFIENYFKNNFTYSLSADNQSGDNTVLGNFLFETKQGHCALYATAMTLMVRELGYPARYVTGCVVNSNKATYNNKTRKFETTLLERDLHAWVEVYFEGLGWLPFDPTPPLTSEVWESTAPIATTATESEQDSITTQDPALSDYHESTSNITTPEIIEELPKKSINIVLLVSIIIALVLAASLIIFISTIRKAEKRLLKKIETVSTRKVAAWLHTLILELLKSKKITIQTGELPSEFAVRAEEYLSEDIDVDFTLIMEILEKLEFSKEELTPEDYLCLATFTLSLYNNFMTGKKSFKHLIYKIIFLLQQ